MAADSDLNFLRTIRNGEIDKVREFVTEGSVNLRRGLTFATLYGQVEISRFFIDKILASPDELAKNPSNPPSGFFTYLVDATEESDESLDSQASSSIQTEKSPVRLDESMNRLQFINQLLVSAAISGSIKIVRLILEYNPTNIEEAASYAAAGGHIEVIKLLVRCGAKNFSTMLTNANVNQRDAAFTEIYNMITQPKEIISSNAGGQIVRVRSRPGLDDYIFLPRNST